MHNNIINPYGDALLLIALGAVALFYFGKETIELRAISFSAVAKLPPLSDKAKDKGAEAAAKTAHGNKVADFQLCKSRERVAAHYYKTQGKGKPSPTAMPAGVAPLPTSQPSKQPLRLLHPPPLRQRPLQGPSLPRLPTKKFNLTSAQKYPRRFRRGIFCARLKPCLPI